MQVRAGEEPRPAGRGYCRGERYSDGVHHSVAVHHSVTLHRLRCGSRRSKMEPRVSMMGQSAGLPRVSMTGQSAGLHFVGVVGAHVRVISLGISRENY
jgi:hypothetical protein